MLCQGLPMFVADKCLHFIRAFANLLDSRMPFFNYYHYLLFVIL